MMSSNSIVAILREDWDPIGIADVPLAQDEYHDYASRIASLIADGITPHDLAGLLLNFERDLMGLTGDVERADETGVSGSGREVDGV